jgi:hypothetical protein
MRSVQQLTGETGKASYRRGASNSEATVSGINKEYRMKKLICLASVVLLSCGIVMAQSTDSSSQSTSATQNTQGTSPTPPGDRRDRYGDTIAPDGSVTPRGANTPGKTQDNSQPSSMSSPSTTQNTQGTSPTPPGDRRDRYGDTVAPDGSVTPKGANTPTRDPNMQPQTTAPDAR